MKGVLASLGMRNQCTEGHVDTVRTFLASSPPLTVSASAPTPADDDADDDDNNVSDCIALAAASGSLPLLRLMLDAGFDPAFNNNQPLAEAARCQHLPAVRFLLDIPAVDVTGDALAPAAGGGNVEMVEALHAHVARALARSGLLTDEDRRRALDHLAFFARGNNVMSETQSTMVALLKQ
ncbi:hypothetical protein DFJ73DRAFT_773632 [Zopfochytrium polystomum]|nr:hypothetical protein DFJ73DRAFT_773632 [Zopfochytrium polystomum]